MLFGLASCGGSDVYRKEEFGRDSIYQRNYAVSAARACEVAQLVLLRQGYQIGMKEPASFAARKEFQPEREENATIEFVVICKEEAFGSMVFANAVETRNELKKSSQAASIGIPSAGSISLPWSKSAEALVKVGGKTIDDKGFYSRFFDALGTMLQGKK